jgi:outer membrane protein OmpA-like peptidoglycan-associated protein/uncharacterized membrane protein (UPF0127 family)
MPTINRPDHTACLHIGEAVLPLALRVADNFFSRFRGLMLSAPLAPAAGLLILDCSSVHCAFMRQAIDVLYLAADGTVLKCVPNLKPWRASFSHTGRDALGRRHPRARHTLELAAGSIARHGIVPGDRLQHRALEAPAAAPAPARRLRQGGASMVEFIVVGPVLTLVGLTLVQYGMLFFAKSQINQASFMAARAGSTGNASLETVRKSYAVGLAPLYGGGKSADEIAASQAAAAADVATHARIELLNPTKESFDDWNAQDLQARLTDTGKRVIRNSHQETPRDAQNIARAQDYAAPASGQTIQDANTLKLRITHGYRMSVPVVAGIYSAYMKWMDPKTDAFHSMLVNDGMVPVVTNVTLEMQSDAIEGETISVPGKGNEGKPQDPGEPPPAQGKPPSCDNFQKCSDPTVPGGGGGSGGGADPGAGDYCPVPVKTEIRTDTLFEFGKAELLPAGQAALDQLIASVKDKDIKSGETLGYTDQIGDDAANLRLSQQRAQAVRDYLSAHGFPNVPMNVIGKGEADPVVSEASCAGRDTKICLAPNRRVVVTLQR